jgi:hypothetical protein
MFVGKAGSLGALLNLQYYGRALVSPKGKLMGEQRKKKMNEYFLYPLLS